MKLGLLVGYSPATMSLPMDVIKQAESLGFSSVWTAEAWGSDAVSPAAWILAQTEKITVGTAIMQMPGRTPAMTAMTAMTLSSLSKGRFILGLGPSGPQVVEGWHGVPYGRPLTRTREYLSIVRKIVAREEKVIHEGYHYQLPYKGKDATGLGKPLKSILYGDPAMKIYTASISPKGMECAGEVADGVFPVWMNPERFDVFQGSLEKGFAEAGGGKSLSDFDVAPFVTTIMADDLEQCRAPIKASKISIDFKAIAPISRAAKWRPVLPTTTNRLVVPALSGFDPKRYHFASKHADHSSLRVSFGSYL